jgi:hypothetical protein
MITICSIQVVVCSNSKRDFTVTLKELKRFKVTLYLFVTSFETIVLDHDCHASGCLFQVVGLSSCWLTPVPAANHYVTETVTTL